MTEEQHVLCVESECGCKRALVGGVPVDHPRAPECHPGVEGDLQALQARWDRVRSLRATSGPNGRPLTLEAIGASFDPPMTRQRVHQMLTGDRPESPGGARRPT